MVKFEIQLNIPDVKILNIETTKTNDWVIAVKSTKKSTNCHRTAWVHTIKRAGIRYRNPYQTRHTYASMMLSGGENIMWVASQMGHVDTEMVMKTYGKWIPNDASKKGYRPVNNWETYI